MTTTLQNKPFLDYAAQLEHLSHKGLIIPDREQAVNILTKISYYSLINGYKDIFKDPNTHNYFPGTTIEDIYQLYLFDAELRGIFLKYILIFEKNIKSSISYHFTLLYGNGINYYQNLNNYDYPKHILIQKNERKTKWKTCLSTDCALHCHIPRCASLGTHDRLNIRRDVDYVSLSERSMQNECMS